MSVVPASMSASAGHLCCSDWTVAELGSQRMLSQSEDETHDSIFPGQHMHDHVLGL